MARINVEERKDFIKAVHKYYGADKNQISRAEAQKICDTFLIPWPNWIFLTKELRTGSRGVYYLPLDVEKPKNGPLVTVQRSTVVPGFSQPEKEEASLTEDSAMIPKPMDHYVPFGYFNEVNSIIASKIFYPTFITGLSGNGKTLMVEQVCAKEGRELVRVGITIETDEDDLIGGFRLVNGETVWQNGPVIVAMERGAVLLLDEIDLASNKIMCLQPVLEGKAVYVKKINKVVYPKYGFNILATANTKGQGSIDGRFIGTNVLNEAFLERFAITIEQDYPDMTTERNILLKQFKANTGVNADVDSVNFINRLVEWSKIIRKSFRDGSVPDIISTRRLVHIIGAYSIFKNENISINFCLARFDEDTKESFSTLWSKLTPTEEWKDEETRGRGRPASLKNVINDDESKKSDLTKKFMSDVNSIYNSLTNNVG